MHVCDNVRAYAIFNTSEMFSKYLHSQAVNISVYTNITDSSMHAVPIMQCIS